MSRHFGSLSRAGDLVRRSEYFIPTAKEDFHEAAIPSHQLLLRAGYMRKSSNGMFMLLPLAIRVMEKLVRIIDKGMAHAGAQKLSMPFLLSQELWEKTGRWATAGGELMRLHDRHGKGYCLGPTHEEIFTELVAREVSSHKQLPLTLYQIGTKFRDEIRPRFGLLRAREFVMKDAYSFHADTDDAERMYNVMDETYSAIFDEVGCEWVKVEADGGNIGSGKTHEFHILSDVGEDRLLHCPCCGYAANDEQAVGDVSGPVSSKHSTVYLAPVDLKAALANSAAEAGASDVPSGMLRRFCVAMPEGQTVNAQKVANAVGCEFELGEVDVGELPNIDVDVEHLVDQTLAQSGATGAFDDSLVGDFRLAQEGDLCKDCSQDQPLLARRGIEVGQIFRLGTKYSNALGAVFDDAKGRKQPMDMGCYGIGVSRIIAAVVESSHDDCGIVWPSSLAPFNAVVLTTGSQKHLKDASQSIAEALANSGADVVLDDRWKDGFGYKLSEAELVGYPFVVIVGRDMHPDKGSGRVEVRHRQSGDVSVITPEEVVNLLSPKPVSR